MKEPYTQVTIIIIKIIIIKLIKDYTSNTLNIPRLWSKTAVIRAYVMWSFDNRWDFGRTVYPMNFYFKTTAFEMNQSNWRLNKQNKRNKKKSNSNLRKFNLNVASKLDMTYKVNKTTKKKNKSYINLKKCDLSALAILSIVSIF